LPVIASGGVGTLEHLSQLGRASRAAQGGIVGAVLGRSLHEKRFTLAQAIEAAAS
jgi:phosphoribosylformimino-5-aminoimidazole carboxamide ribotide isomerase